MKIAVESKMIEQLQPSDWQRFKRIRLAALRDSPDSFGSTLDEALRRSDSEWEKNLHSVPTFIACIDQIDQGIVRCTPNNDKLKSMYLIGMWVAPESRRSGLAKQLIETLIEWARVNGCEEIVLDVADQNTAAIGLYEKLMFLPNGKTGHLLAPREHIKEHTRVRVL